ncbi:MAG: polysaccharide biosynthesis tyrosine autokinase [Longimicrobiales bacterium]
MALRYQLRVLRRRWWAVALVASVVVFGAWWRSHGEVPLYSAVVQLQKQPDRDLLEAGWAGFYELTPEAINAQIQVVQSQPVLSPVIDSLGARLVPVDAGVLRSRIAQDIEIEPAAPAGLYSVRAVGSDFQLLDEWNRELHRAAHGQTLSGPGFVMRPVARMDYAQPVGLRVLSVDDALMQLQESLHVEQVKGTMIMAIRFTSPDPAYARDVANAIGRSYMWYSGRRNRLDAARRKEILAERLAILADSLLLSRKALHATDRMPASANAAPNQEAAGNALVDGATRLRDLQFTRSQLVELRSALEQPGAAGVQRALALGHILPGVGMHYERITNLQAQRLQAVKRDQLSATSGAVVAIDSAMAAAREDILELALAQIQTLDGQITNANARVRELQSDYNLLSSRQAETDALRQQTDAIERVYTDLSERYYEATINERLENASVDIISNAALPRGPDSSHQTRSLLFALVVGLLMGVLAAFLLEQFDTRVRDADDVERTAAVNVIGTIPELRGRTLRPLAVQTDELTVGAEAYRKLRTNLRFVRADRPRVIAVTSPNPEEGKSVTAANLALAIAQQGNDVLIIDGDLRRPVQHEIFGVAQQPGLTDVLVGMTEPEHVLRPYPGLKNVWVLSSGTEAPNPAELLGSDVFSRLLHTMIERFDTVIIDTPPVNLVTDAALIGAVTDGVVLVAEAGRTDRTVLTDSVNELRRARGSLLGIVLNRAAAEGAYGRYGAYYGNRALSLRKNGRRAPHHRLRDWVATRI